MCTTVKKAFKNTVEYKINVFILHLYYIFMLNQKNGKYIYVK